MAIKYSMPIEAIPNLTQKKVSCVTQATSGDAAVTTSINSVLDALKTYGLMATA